MLVRWHCYWTLAAVPLAYCCCTDYPYCGKLAPAAAVPSLVYFDVVVVVVVVGDYNYFVCKERGYLNLKFQ